MKKSPLFYAALIMIGFSSAAQARYIQWYQGEQAIVVNGYVTVNFQINTGVNVTSNAMGNSATWPSDALYKLDGSFCRHHYIGEAVQLGGRYARIVGCGSDALKPVKYAVQFSDDGSIETGYQF